MPRTEAIRFKGTRQGVHLVIDPGPELPEVLLELDQRLRGADQFFRSASVMLNIGGREMDQGQFIALQDVLSRYGLTVISAQTHSSFSREVFRGLGLEVDEVAAMPAVGLAAAPAPPVTLEEPAPAPTPAPRPNPAVSDAVVVHKTLRSGQEIHHPGDICLIGDVNPGAEVVAGKNVIIWGSLRGVVQAGTNGDEGAVVCALELAPTQLRIASLVTRQPETADAKIVPEMARIVEGQIVVEQWLPRSRRFGARR